MLIEPLYSRMRSARPGHLLDTFLPAAIALYGARLSHFADCGAGVGRTALRYENMLRTHLREDSYRQSSVLCFEPLPENLAQIQKFIEPFPQISVRPVAVSDFAGKARFVIPSRMRSEDNLYWTPGTSYSGYLVFRGAEHARNLAVSAMRSETIEVNVVKLENERTFDFVKLDLQGGELAALRGLGNKLRQVKIMYSETQLLRRSGVVGFFRDNGFICLYDRLQFGFKDDSTAVSLFDLARLGVIIDEIKLPANNGKPLACRGFFDLERSPVDNNDGEISQIVVDELLQMGISYMQTDILAINIREAGDLLNLI